MKTKIIISFFALLTAIAFTACKNQPATTAEQQPQEEETIDYEALTDQELPSIEQLEALVDFYQTETAALKTTGSIWDRSEANVRAFFEPKGYKVERRELTILAAMKNAKLVEEDYIFSIEPEQADSLSMSVVFRAQGDMYVSGEYIVSDENIYNVLVERVKAAGYTPAPDHQWAYDGNEVFTKDKYFFVCDKKTGTVALHYDFNTF